MIVFYYTYCKYRVKMKNSVYVVKKLFKQIKNSEKKSEKKLTGYTIFITTKNT